MAISKRGPTILVPPLQWDLAPLVASAALILTTSFFGVWGLIVAGERCGELNAAEVVYRLVLLFAPDGENLRMSPDCALPWQLLVARTTGFLAAFAAILQVFLSGLHRLWNVWRLRCVKGHVAVIGFTPEALEVAALFRRREETVIAAGQAPGDDHRDHCHSHGVPVVYAPITDIARLFETARVGKAKRVFVDLPSDADTITLAKAAECGRKFVHIRDCAFAARLGDYEMGHGTRIVNIATLTARDVLARFPIYAWAELHRHDRVHAVLAGYSDTAEALIRAIGTLCHTRSLAAPRVVVQDANPAAASSRFRASFPHVRSEHVDVWFEEENIDALLDRSRPITAVFVTSDSGERNLALAVTLQQRLVRERGDTPPILVHLRDRELPVNGAAQFGEPLRAFGHLRQVLADSEIAFDDGDKIAKAIHAKYLEHNPGKPWETLQDTYREANRRVADHIPVKLMIAGFELDDVDRPLADFPHAVMNLTPELITALAKAEHRSWCAERAFNGWRPGAQSSPTLRIHDDLVDFESLDPAAQAKARRQVQDLAAMLAVPGRKPELRQTVSG